MIRQDILLTANNDFTINNGDFVVGQSDEQNVDLLLELGKGHIREKLLNGVGIVSYVNSPNNAPNLRNKISNELQEDGYKLTLFYVDPNTNNINIDFN